MKTYIITFYKSGKIVNELTKEYKGTRTNAMFYASNFIMTLTNQRKYNNYTYVITLKDGVK